MSADYKYIYGPVYSWRLGRSLGIDPISPEHKICSFDCLYCQVGRARPYGIRRKVFVPTAKIVEEIRSLPRLKVDYITFSGAGEPTLARNLGRMISAVRKIRNERIAVLTNASLIDRKDVQKDLALADLVVAKLDASSEPIFKKINHPAPGVKLAGIISGIKRFRASYHGRLALQVMFTDKNIAYAKAIAGIAKDIRPDEVQINTPLRPSGERPLSRKDITAIKRYFKGMYVMSVYDARRKKVRSISSKEVLRRRGKV